MANPDRLPRNSGCDPCDTGEPHTEPCTAWQSPAKREKTAWERQCYGCPLETMKTLAKDLQEGSYPIGLRMGAMSILSDSQELIAMGRANEARQAINRAKFLIDQIGR